MVEEEEEEVVVVRARFEDDECDFSLSCLRFFFFFFDAFLREIPPFRLSADAFGLGASIFAFTISPGFDIICDHSIDTIVCSCIGASTSSSS